MRSNAYTLLLALVTVVAIGACARTAPVYNVSSMPVMSNQPKLALDDVTKAIVRAGVGQGWQMQVVKPGEILGTLNLREHHAVVSVNYDTKAYNITYKDSSNLKYDGENIHKNYNGWIQNLDRAIKTQLLAM